MSEEKKKRVKRARQEWTPHWTVNLLHKLWMILFSAFKIALGAGATVLIICVVCGFVFAGILGEYLQEDVVPSVGLDLDEIENPENSYLYYVDSDGAIKQLRRIYGENNSEWVSFENIPEDLVRAAIAIEDKRFFEHQGVDWITTVKACARIFFGDDSMGGSTITQQLVKNATGENSVTVQRKVTEIFTAIDLEKRYDKYTIMEHYLNRIYFGNRCTGVKTAAATYFGKELEMLTVAECASLISITNNPSLYNPYRTGLDADGLNGQERNRDRQVDTLYEMRNQGWITEEEYQEALAQEMVFKRGIDFEDSMAKCVSDDCGYRGLVSTYNHEDEKYYCPECGTEAPLSEYEAHDVYSWFEDTVLEDVAYALAAKDGIELTSAALGKEEFKELRSYYMQKIQRSGYHIYTTLDMDIQDQVDKIYTDLSQIPATRSGQQLQSAIVIVDNETGDVVAMAGGVGEKLVYDAYNCATDAKLQTGSSIKPLTVYAPAFELEAITPATIIKDMPYEYREGEEEGPWPKNDIRQYSYTKSIRSAIVSSTNAVAVNTLDIISTGYSFAFAKEKFGLSTLTTDYITSSGQIKTDNNLAALGLGAQTVGISVRDMTCAFATFANDGVYRRGRTFTKVYDSEGNLVLDNTQYSEKILSEKTVQYMNYCLDDAAAVGTGSNGDFRGMSVAAKTGTTSSNRDRWYCGYTPYYTASVWCGYLIPEVIQLVGDYSNPAGRLFKKVMQPIHDDLPNATLYDAWKFKNVEICLDSGLIATDACKADVRITEENMKDFTRVEVVKVLKDDENVPTEKCNKHVLVDFCTVGHGVANEYCKLFAEEQKTQPVVDEKAQPIVVKKSLVKMTQEELEMLMEASKYGLLKEFLMNDYVYLVTDTGKDGIFKGFKENANKDIESPYIVCPTHTKEAWEDYLATKEPEKPEEPGGPSTPVTPDQPDSPVLPNFPDFNTPGTDNGQNTGE